MTVQDVDRALAKKLAEANIVICTTADPASERYMMQQLEDGIRMLQLAWVEPHAMAGHSIWLHQGKVPIESIFEGGRYKFPAIRWSSEPAETLPGCGASHLPGAGNRIRWIASQVVEHAIDRLTAPAALPTNSGHLWKAVTRSLKSGGSESGPHRPAPASSL